MKLGATGTLKADGTRVVVTGTWNSGEGIVYCRRADGCEALLLEREVEWDAEPATADNHPRGRLTVYVNNRRAGTYPCPDKATARKIVTAFDFEGCTMLHGIWQGIDCDTQTYPIIIR